MTGETDELLGRPLRLMPLTAENRKMKFGRRKNPYQEGRSERAVQAEMDGLIIDKIVLKRLKAAGLKATLDDLDQMTDETSSGGWLFTPEWHHVGRSYREARFFDPRVLRDPWIGELVAAVRPVVEERLALQRARRKARSAWHIEEGPEGFSVCCGSVVVVRGIPDRASAETALKTWRRTTR